MRRTYIIAYDISDPKRWRAVYQTMLGHGDPIQLSVFACRLSATERSLLEEKLTEHIDKQEDSLLFVDAGQAERPIDDWFVMIGRKRERFKEAARFFVV